MKKGIIIAALATTCAMWSMPAQGQTFNRVGVHDEEHIPARKPIPYYHLRESDVMWKKRIWRIVDMREKINNPLYYPTAPIEDRMSLTSLILRAQQGLLDEQTDRIPDAEMQNPRLDPSTTKLPILQIYEDEFFRKVLTISDIETRFGVKEEESTIEDPETGQLITTRTKTEVHPEEVLQWILKEDWFFNRTMSRLEVRIIGMGAVRHYVADNSMQSEDAEIRQARVFWVYFPELRPILAKYAVTNTNNDAERRTFDDIFFKRFFNSFIAQESNVYNDRQIQDYELGLYSLWEAEKIKERIFNLEQDLWSY